MSRSIPQHMDYRSDGKFARTVSRATLSITVEVATDSWDRKATFELVSKEAEEKTAWALQRLLESVDKRVEIVRTSIDSIDVFLVVKCARHANPNDSEGL